MKGLALALALSLAAGSPSFGPRETAARVPVGIFLKAVMTDAGRLSVFRSAIGCQLVLRGEVVDSVDLVTCAS